MTHHGPVIDYLANCNGPCETVDKASLKFNKIDAVGLLGQSTGPGAAGFWGADKLRTNNNTWTVTIPSTVAKGNYILRHEIIALHAARTINGAQNYPHCINLQVTGSGTDNLPSGTLGNALYKPGEPGIEIDIYKPLQYQMPGPPLYKAGTTITPANSGVGGGLDNLGMGAGFSASLPAASQAITTASSIASGAVANALSASVSVNTSTASSVATTTPNAGIASAPYSNSTASNVTTHTSYTPMTSQINIVGASSSSPLAPAATQTAFSLIANLSASVGSVQVNAPVTSTPSYSASTQIAAATTPIVTSSVVDVPAQQSTPAAAAAATSTAKTYPSMPLHPTQSTFSGLSVAELMEYLRAIVAELSRRINLSQSKRRRHGRDLGSSR